MEASKLLVKSLADRIRTARNHCSHKRIRAYPPAPMLRKLQSPLQMSLIHGS
jgi:hypothetical protein